MVTSLTITWPKAYIISYGAYGERSSICHSNSAITSHVAKVDALHVKSHDRLRGEPAQACKASDVIGRDDGGVDGMKENSIDGLHTDDGLGEA